MEVQRGSLDDYDLELHHQSFHDDKDALCPMRWATHRKTRQRFSVRCFCKIGLTLTEVHTLKKQVDAWWLAREHPHVLTVEDLVEGDEYVYAFTQPLSGQTLMGCVMHEKMHGSDSVVYTHGRSLSCGREEWARRIVRQVL